MLKLISSPLTSFNYCYTHIWPITYELPIKLIRFHDFHNITQQLTNEFSQIFIIYNRKTEMAIGAGMCLFSTICLVCVHWFCTLFCLTVKARYAKYEVRPNEDGRRNTIQINQLYVEHGVVFWMCICVMSFFFILFSVFVVWGWCF